MLEGGLGLLLVGLLIKFGVPCGAWTAHRFQDMPNSLENSQRKCQANVVPKRRVFLSCAAFFAAWAAGTPTVHAKILYVDTMSQRASDMEPGTADRPMKTITQAASLARQGDVIAVRSGIYRQEHIVFQADGTSDSPIVLKAVQGASVTITGSVVVGSGWRNSGGGTYSHLLAGLTPYFPPAPHLVRGGSLSRNQVFVDDQYITQVAPTYKLAPGSFYISDDHNELHLRLGDDTNPNLGRHHIEVTNTTGPLLTTNGHSYIRIEGLHFERAANLPQSEALIQIPGSAHCKIDHCTVRYAAGAGITIYAGVRRGDNGVGHVISNSAFNHNGQEGIHAFQLRDCEFLGNETSFNNTFPDKTFDTQWEAGGNKFAETKSVSLIRHLSHDNVGSGIWFDISNTEALITKSTTYGNRVGIHYEISYSGTITNNVSYGNRAYPRDSDSGIGIQISTSAGTKVYNNTVAWNENAGIVVSGGIRDDGTGHSVLPYGNDIENNIIANNGLRFGGQNFLLALPPIPAHSNAYIQLSPNKSDYNLFWSLARESFRGSAALSQAVSASDLARWQFQSGLDQHSKWGDPKFIGSQEKPNFRIAADSPARASGVDTQQADADLNRSRMRQLWDIGAYIDK